MARQTGITRETEERLILDAGAVYKNYGIPVRTITLNAVVAANTCAVTIDGSTTTFTFVAANPGERDVVVGGTDTISATNLAAKITALTGVTATSDGAVVTVTGDNALINLTITGTAGRFTIGTNGFNTTLMGATRGGSTFVVETEYKIIEADGARGPVKGMRRITSAVAKLTANFLEMSTDLIAMVLPGSSSSAGATHGVITRSVQLRDTDYLTNVAILADVSGESVPVICIVDNAMVDGNLELTFADKEEGVLTAQFTAHYDPDDLDSEPWEIRYPN